MDLFGIINNQVIIKKASVLIATLAGYGDPVGDENIEDDRDDPAKNESEALLVRYYEVNDRF